MIVPASSPHPDRSPHAKNGGMHFGRDGDPSGTSNIVSLSKDKFRKSAEWLILNCWQTTKDSREEFLELVGLAMLTRSNKSLNWAYNWLACRPRKIFATKVPENNKQQRIVRDRGVPLNRIVHQRETQKLRECHSPPSTKTCVVILTALINSCA